MGSSGIGPPCINLRNLGIYGMTLCISTISHLHITVILVPNEQRDKQQYSKTVRHMSIYLKAYSKADVKGQEIVSLRIS